MKSAELYVVMVTVPDDAAADTITGALLDEHLCACVNRITGIRSSYWWQGKIEHSDEYLLLIKTTHDAFDRVKEKVTQLHPYDVPEIVALPMADVSEKYAAWMRKETAGADGCLPENKSDGF
jgi:uncharacterized protein involved in tolerance to divalent cations